MSYKMIVILCVVIGFCLTHADTARAIDEMLPENGEKSKDEVVEVLSHFEEDIGLAVSEKLIKVDPYSPNDEIYRGFGIADEDLLVRISTSSDSGYRLFMSGISDEHPVTSISNDKNGKPLPAQEVIKCHHANVLCDVKDTASEIKSANITDLETNKQVSSSWWGYRVARGVHVNDAGDEESLREFREDVFRSNSGCDFSFHAVPESDEMLDVLQVEKGVDKCGYKSTKSEYSASVAESIYAVKFGVQINSNQRVGTYYGAVIFTATARF